MRKLIVLTAIGGLIAFLVKKLRGEPAPQFANHPTVRGGPLPDLVPAPADPTVPDPADAGPSLVPAPEDPTVPAPPPASPAAPAGPATDQPELELEPLVPAPADPTVAAPAGTDLVSDDDAPAAPAPAAAASGDQTWVDPVDGECPDGYPIKAKVKSGIFHQPGGLAYDRTNPDRCYPDVASAEADGLRAAKR